MENSNRGSQRMLVRKGSLKKCLPKSNFMEYLSKLSFIGTNAEKKVILVDSECVFDLKFDIAREMTMSH